MIRRRWWSYYNSAIPEQQTVDSISLTNHSIFTEHQSRSSLLRSGQFAEEMINQTLMILSWVDRRAWRENMLQIFPELLLMSITYFQVLSSTRFVNCVPKNVSRNLVKNMCLPKYDSHHTRLDHDSHYWLITNVTLHLNQLIMLTVSS